MPADMTAKLSLDAAPFVRGMQQVASAAAAVGRRARNAFKPAGDSARAAGISVGQFTRYLGAGYVAMKATEAAGHAVALSMAKLRMEAAAATGTASDMMRAYEGQQQALMSAARSIPLLGRGIATALDAPSTALQTPCSRDPIPPDAVGFLTPDPTDRDVLVSRRARRLLKLFNLRAHLFQSACTAPPTAGAVVPHPPVTEALHPILSRFLGCLLPRSASHVSLSLLQIPIGANPRSCPTARFVPHLTSCGRFRRIELTGQFHIEFGYPCWERVAIMATAQKERQILRAAERLFASRRFHEVTMDDVSKAARVGKGTIYRYFKNKDDLFACMVSSGFDGLCEAVGRIASQDLPFELQLGQVLTAIKRFFERRRPLFRMMHSEQARIAVSRSAIHSHWLKRRHDLDQGVADVLRRGVKAGVVRKDVSPETLAACLLSMLRGTALPPARRGAKEMPVAMVVDLFLRGAEASPAADRGISGRPPPGGRG